MHRCLPSFPHPFPLQTQNPTLALQVKECDAQGALFLDDVVPVSDPRVTWKRPSELFAAPVWRSGASGGESSTRAGRLGACGFLTALNVCQQDPGALQAALICMYPSMGIYVFQFHKQGAPVKVQCIAFLGFVGPPMRLALQQVGPMQCCVCCTRVCTLGAS